MAAAGLPVRLAARGRGMTGRSALPPTVATRLRDGRLVPAVVQDVRDGRVLMLAWMDAEALAATLATGEVHFHSRSRGRLWRKGETSGNVLRLVDLAADCDGDALLVRPTRSARPAIAGPARCFDPDGTRRNATAPRGSPGSSTLWATIAARAADRPAGSYTTSLLDGGVDAVGRKVTEEATEVLLAAKDDAVAEAADRPTRPARRSRARPPTSLYHALVLLAERGLPPGAVIETLPGATPLLTSRRARRLSAPPAADLAAPLPDADLEPLPGDRLRDGCQRIGDPLTVDGQSPTLDEPPRLTTGAEHARVRQE